MRFLFAPLPTSGHVLPLLPFAQALHAAAHDIAFALPTVTEPLMQEHVGFRVFPLPPFDALNAAAPRLGIDVAGLDRVEHERLILRELLLGPHLERWVEAILALAHDWPPDTVVWGDANYAATVAADGLGRPHACVQVVAGGLLLHRPWHGLREPLAARLDALRVAVGLEPDPGLVRPYGYLVLSPFPPSLRAPEEPLLPTRLAVRPAPTVSQAGGQLPSWVAELPPRHAQPRVYVTLGTLLRPADSVPLFRAILDGLADEPLQLLVTVGPRLDPAELHPLPANVHVEQFVPQELLLPHCDLVVCHGGSGTLVGVLDHGLPMVLVPARADQPTNARAAAAAGVARVLVPSDVTPARVRTEVRAVMGEPAYRAAAQRLQAELHALPPMEHAVRRLEELASRRHEHAGE